MPKQFSLLYRGKCVAVLPNLKRANERAKRSGFSDYAIADHALPLDAIASASLASQRVARSQAARRKQAMARDAIDGTGASGDRLRTKVSDLAALNVAVPTFKGGRGKQAKHATHSRSRVMGALGGERVPERHKGNLRYFLLPGQSEHDQALDLWRGLGSRYARALTLFDVCENICAHPQQDNPIPRDVCVEHVATVELVRYSPNVPTQGELRNRWYYRSGDEIVRSPRRVRYHVDKGNVPTFNDAAQRIVSRARSELDALVAEYLAKGGTVKQLRPQRSYRGRATSIMRGQHKQK